jgi:hypothetical protein
MAKASKHKFKDIKKKLKADLALSIENVLKKLSASSHDSAKKLAKSAAAKVARDFVKKLKKDDKAEKPSAKRRPAKRSAATAKRSAASKKTTASKRKPVTRKPVVKKEPLNEAEVPAPVLETSNENLS